MHIDEITYAAKLVKVVRLAQLPGMDTVAIRLNCEPTHDELQVAEFWVMAFELAERETDNPSDKNIFQVALELSAKGAMR